jgi:hypothetical protein
MAAGLSTHELIAGDPAHTFSLYKTWSDSADAARERGRQRQQIVITATGSSEEHSPSKLRVETLTVGAATQRSSAVTLDDWFTESFKMSISPLQCRTFHAAADTPNPCFLNRLRGSNCPERRLRGAGRPKSDTAPPGSTTNRLADVELVKALRDPGLFV